MKGLKIFNFEELPVRTLTVDEEPYFIGKDVADILGYSRPSDAIKAHVDDEDKLIRQFTVSGQNRNMLVINESGLYSLIFSSKLESAKRFKRWVTSEVLPSIRKTGSYQVPQNSMEALELMFQATKETKQEVDIIKSDVIDLKENQRLDPGEYNYLSSVISKRVNFIKNQLSLLNNRKVNSELYKDINTEVKRMAGVQTRSQLKQKHFNDVLEMINNWMPAQSTLYVIKQQSFDLKNSL
ncbi:BRO family protein [Staphylococcus gallinarum]|uniref:BRO family protein n=1 Tax=Staphylococcus gallinarum TaxID=1293 RepID=UPI001E567B04|nr:BRO family protein [Staphylococcus gallinarum]MCD8825393.1 ORF6C domain-containing protein [Staphylococcus gallinarum]